jgi:rod shape-determining protein MreD
MRWVPFIIVAYLAAVLQASLGRILVIERLGFGPIGPDVMAMVAIFVALWVRSGAEVIVAVWTLGMLVDLTTGSGVGVTTVVGPMTIAYSAAAGLLLRIREGLFRERALPQMIVAALFVVLAHTIWALLQAMLGRGAVSFATFGRTMLQIVASAVYTAILMPLMHTLLSAVRGLLFNAPPNGRRRGRSVRPGI